MTFRLRSGKKGLELRLHDLEATIMDVVWGKHLSSFAVGDVLAILEKQRDIAYTTVMTTMSRLAEKGVQLFYTQVFRDNFFHADAHAGNIWVDAAHADNPRFIALDFGIMGTLPERDQYWLAENFLALFRQRLGLLRVVRLAKRRVLGDTKRLAVYLHVHEVIVGTVIVRCFRFPILGAVLGFGVDVGKVFVFGRVDGFRFRLDRQIVGIVHVSPQLAVCLATMAG